MKSKAMQFDRRAMVSMTTFALTAVAIRLTMVMIGVRFDFFTASAYWQFLDLELLQSQPWSSLNYLHAQPPLMNLVTAAALQFGTTWAARILHAMSFGIGIVLCLVVFDLTRRWFRQPIIAWLCGLWVAFNPAYIIYDHNYFYTSPVACLLVVAARSLWRFFRTDRAVDYLGYAVALLLMVLTRSLYQPVWLAVNLVWPLLIRRPSRELVVIASGCVVLSLMWPAKNAIVFGVFSASSWSGMNMYNAIYKQSYDEAEMAEFYAGRGLPPRRPDGAESVLASIRPFNHPEVYLEVLGKRKPTGQPAATALDATLRSGNYINFNHWIYIRASKVYAEDYRTVIRKQPTMLVRTFVSSLGYYFRPATHNHVLRLTPDSANNLQVMSPLDAVFRRTFYGQWTSVCFTLIAGTMVLFAGVPLTLRRRSAPLALRAFLVFAWMNVGYVFLIGNLFENYENMRFRFETEPLLLLGLIALAAAYATADRDGSEAV